MSEILLEEKKSEKLLSYRKAQFSIVDNDLIITIPFSNMNLALRQYMKLTNKDNSQFKELHEKYFELNKLPVVLESEYSKTLGAIGHFFIDYDCSLMIRIDYGNLDFACWSYLDFIGDYKWRQIENVKVRDYCLSKYVNKMAVSK